MPLPRPCLRCGIRFQPSSRSNKLCLICRQGVFHENFIKMINHRINKQLINNGIRKKIH